MFSRPTPRNLGNRGYVGTLDLILAMTLFLAIVYMVLWANSDAKVKVLSFEAALSYKEKALRMINLLLKTPGIPANWEILENSTQIKSIGFAAETNVIDRKKIKRFAELPASEARRLLGLSKENCRIEIAEKDEEGREIPLFEYGYAESPVSSIERLAILEERPVIFRLSLS